MRELLSKWRDSEVYALAVFPAPGDDRFKTRWQLLAMADSYRLLLDDAALAIDHLIGAELCLVLLSPVRGLSYFADYGIDDPDRNVVEEIRQEVLAGLDALLYQSAWNQIICAGLDGWETEQWTALKQSWQKKEPNSDF